MSSEALFSDIENILSNLPKSDSELHIALKNLYRVIKKYSACMSNPSSLSVQENNKILSIVKSLLLILLNNDLSTDIMLLCGTCFVLFIANLFNTATASSFLLYTYCHFDKKFSETQGITVGNEHVIESVSEFFMDYEFHITNGLKLFENYSNYLQNSPVSKTSTFQQIVILSGIVSCQVIELYSYSLDCFHKKPFLIVIFEVVYQCCLVPSIHQYHAFLVLINWLKMCEMCIHKFQKSSKQFFSTNSDIVQKVLHLLESNWQSPIKGINGRLRELYNCIIKINKLESEITSHDSDLIYYLLNKTMMLSWQVKGKYFLLSVILQNMDYKEFLNNNPDAPAKIIFNLKANYISSSVAEVYKVIVCTMKKSNSDKQFSLEWCRWWCDPILNSLKSNDRLLIQNVTNNLLTWTMKEFPESYELMVETEDQNQDDSLKLILLRVAKECFPLKLGDKELKLIENNLHHCDIKVRSEVLSILCSSSKKSAFVNSAELEYVKIFVLENLNIDSAPFHQYLLSQLHTLLVRIRDSLAQQFRSKKSIDECSLDMPQTKFVDWLFYTSVQNTFPGACFQRRRFCLQLLHVIFEVFIKSTLGCSRKENPSKSVEKVIKWAQQNNLWLFFSNDSLTYIFPCITDFADEIRSLCANLLSSYTSWPSFENYITVKKATITEFALTLCNHPDYRNNDGGAHICCIIFNRLCQQTKEYQQALDFLKYLAYECQLQLRSSKEDFLSAAMQKPIHGVLLALQYCLADSRSFFIKSDMQLQDETLAFMKDLIHLCFDIVDYMLKVMKGENENYYCPSFSDIGKAMVKLVMSQRNSSDEEYESSIASRECVNESSDCSTLCDLLLSCCWHSIKNSCFLLSELSSSILDLNIHSIEKKSFLHEIAQKISSVLIDCRHRGVVEACCGALNSFCANLLKDKSLYEDITLGLLKEIFLNLNDSSKVSVTRRSAGIPLLFQAVVSSEGNNFNRQLLPYTIDNLLNLISHPVPSPDSLSEKTDIPQAHSYHILKALVSDARLSQSILPYFDSIIPVCITGFSSPIWAVRNGALQLFGVILPRVCGQKKVRDDDSEHNTVSAFELFARCPSLKTYLLQELVKCVKFHQEKKLCSELVPILSLLVKLMPECDDQRQYMLEFMPLLMDLLDIPVWKVRDLAASALAVLMHSSEIINLMKETANVLKNENINANKIHSFLLIVHHFMKKRNYNILSNVSVIEDSLKEIYILVEAKLNCHLLLGIILDMMLLISDAKTDSSLCEFMDKIITDCTAPQTNEIGNLFYENKIFSVGLKRCTLESIQLYLECIFSKNKNTKIIFLHFLSEKFSYQKSEHFCGENNLELWKDIFVSVLKYLSPTEHPSVILETLKFMINLCNDDLTGKFMLQSTAESVMKSLECHLNPDSGLSVSAYAFTMWSICIKHLLVKPIESIINYIEKWNVLFCTYCHPRSNDVLRFQAATSLANVGPLLMRCLTTNIQKGSDNIIKTFIHICEGSLLLLQDEDEDIRNEASKFPSQIPNNFMTDQLQFNVGIQVIVHYMFQELKHESFYLLYLWNRHQNYPSTVKILQSYSTEKKRNLFEQEYVNVFSEPHQLLMHHYSNLKEILSYLNVNNYGLYHEYINMFVCDLEAEIQDIHILLGSLETENSNYNFTFHHQVYLSLKKIRCQLEVLLNQNSLISAEDPLHYKLINLKEMWCSIEKLLPSSVSWFLNVL